MRLKVIIMTDHVTLQQVIETMLFGKIYTSESDSVIKNAVYLIKQLATAWMYTKNIILNNRKRFCVLTAREARNFVISY